MVALAGGGADLTTQAVTRFLDALPADAYRVMLREQATGKVQSRTFNRADLLKSVQWLRRENALGRDVYVRPADSRYLLVDDLKPEAVERMRRDGVAPAAVVETSRGNVQAWVRLTSQLRPEEGTEAARLLAQRYGGDPKSADHGHIGRLPGFTNRKPVRQVAGRSPFVLVHHWAGQVADKAADLVRDARQAIAQRAADKRADDRLLMVSYMAEPDKFRDSGADLSLKSYCSHARDVRRIMSNRGEAEDWSTIDFRVAQRMLVDGWNKPQVSRAIRDGSPEIERRHRGQEISYSDRTVEAAAKSENVTRHRAAEALKEQEYQAPKSSIPAPKPR